MRAGSQTSAANITNSLPLFDVDSGHYPGSNLRHVQITCSVCSIMTDFYIVAIVGCVLRFQRYTITYRANGCASRGCKVSAQMGPKDFYDRVKTAEGIT